MPRMHSYAVRVAWTGNQGTGTSGYRHMLWYLHLCAVAGVTVLADAAKRLHAEASAKCFIANSVNFPVKHEPVIEIAT